MKRQLGKGRCAAVLAAAVIAAGLSACGSTGGSRTADKGLYEKGLELIQLLDEMVQSEEYVGLYTDSSDIKEIVHEVSKGDYTAPKAVYAISVSEENLANLADLDALEEASDELRHFMMQKMLASLVTQMNGMKGVANLAAASVCTVEETFVSEEAADVVYLYTYEDATPVTVTFIEGEDKTVSAAGTFAFFDGFSGENIEEIQSALSYIGVEVTEVFPEK